MKIRYCPKCKSVKVRVDITPSVILGAPQKWECLDCGFNSNSIFPEEKIEEKKIKNYKKNNDEN